MELLSSPDNKVTGLVDYAHNKLSYQKLFSSTSKEFPGYGRYVVMGAVGGKAYNRRQELPEEAAKWADLMIYTTGGLQHGRSCGDLRADGRGHA